MASSFREKSLPREGDSTGSNGKILRTRSIGGGSSRPNSTDEKVGLARTRSIGGSRPASSNGGDPKTNLVRTRSVGGSRPASSGGNLGQSRPSSRSIGMSNRSTSFKSPAMKKDQNSIKVVVVGDGAVGKTSMLMSLIQGKFPREYVPTVFENHELNRKLEGEESKLEIWDTAGQEEYQALRSRSYADTDVFVVVFSIDNRSSFLNLKSRWIPEIKAAAPHVPILVVGTKADLREDEGVIAEMASYGDPMLSYEQCEESVLSWGANQYAECSALTKQQLSEVFDHMIMIYRDKRKKIEKTQSARGKGGCTMM